MSIPPRTDTEKSSIGGVRLLNGIGQYTVHKTLPSLGEVGLACETRLEHTIHSWIVFSKYFHYGHTHVWKPLVMEGSYLLFNSPLHSLTFKFGVPIPNFSFPISMPISRFPFLIPRFLFQLE